MSASTSTSGVPWTSQRSARTRALSHETSARYVVAIVEARTATGAGDLTGRRVLVVGASAGIGRAGALRLAARGAEVVFCGRRADRLDEAVRAAGRGHAVAADVSDPAQCERLVATATHALGGIDLLVFAAGVSRIVRLRDADADEWQHVLRTNVVGPSLVIQAALPHLAPGAVVAVLSSEAVGTPFPGLVPYAASKAALEELVRGYRVEHPEIRFCRVTVGSTEGTEFARDFDAAVAGELIPQWLALGRLPARLMDVDELGATLADALAVALGAPGVDCQDIVLRAPGRVSTDENADAMLAKVDEVTSAAD
jgi:NAD(P)-dependent dehydrogenase (short-subunit alcohol dehydrogenase family)